MVTNECGGFTYDASSDTWRRLTAEEKREISRHMPKDHGCSRSAPVTAAAAVHAFAGEARLPEKKAGAAPQQPASSSPTSAGARDLATILEELHVEPGRAVDGVDEGAFAASIVEQWHRAASAALRREFRNDLGLYAAFRAGIRDGTLPGYDTETGEKLKRRDPVLNAVAEAAAEDKAAGVDPRLPVEARARQVWDVTPSIRAAFEKWGGFESFLEWRRRTERSRA